MSVFSKLIIDKEEYEYSRRRDLLDSIREHVIERFPNIEYIKGNNEIYTECDLLISRFSRMILDMRDGKYKNRVYCLSSLTLDYANKTLGSGFRSLFHMEEGGINQNQHISLDCSYYKKYIHCHDTYGDEDDENREDKNKMIDLLIDRLIEMNENIGKTCEKRFIFIEFYNVNYLSYSVNYFISKLKTENKIVSTYGKEFYLLKNVSVFILSSFFRVK